MTVEKFEEIMDGLSDTTGVGDDNILSGLQIIRKYAPGEGSKGVLCGIIYLSAVEKLIDSGITEEEVKELRRLDWMVFDDRYMVHSV